MYWNSRRYTRYVRAYERQWKITPVAIILFSYYQFIVQYIGQTSILVHFLVCFIPIMDTKNEWTYFGELELLVMVLTPCARFCSVLIVEDAPCHRWFVYKTVSTL